MPQIHEIHKDLSEKRRFTKWRQDAREILRSELRPPAAPVREAHKQTVVSPQRVRRHLMSVNQQCRRTPFCGLLLKSLGLHFHNIPVHL